MRKGLIYKIMQNIIISKRLLWFAERVRQGVNFFDIGTDHAKLPVYLVKSGKISNAVASDIGEGPVERARKYIALNRLCSCISTRIGDGLCGIDITPPADIAICGMGGETIINILSQASAVKSSDIRLMLQPMTDFAMLRRYLADNGFYAVDEDIVESDNRMYQCIIVGYDGVKRVLSDAEAELGKLCIEKQSSSFIKYVERRYNIVKKCIDGMKRASLDTEKEENLLKEYDKFLTTEFAPMKGAVK